MGATRACIALWRKKSPTLRRPIVGRSNAQWTASAQVFNEERPHHALQMCTPSSCYKPSPREYPARIGEPEYGSALQVRRVRATGDFSWANNNIFLSEVLEGEMIGLLPLDDRYYRVYFAEFPLARFDSHAGGSGDTGHERAVTFVGEIAITKAIALVSSYGARNPIVKAYPALRYAPCWARL